jgi:hypothetical protein
MSQIAFELNAKTKLFEKASPGDVFFSSSKTPISWLIRKITGFNRSHVFVKVNDRTIIEADVGGIKLRPIKKYLDDSKTEIELISLPTNVNRQSFIEKLNEKVGSYYDYGILIGGVISAIFHITRWQENILNGVSRYTCSEYVAECLAAEGVSFGLHTSQITPKELYYNLMRLSHEEA